ncbi:MAG: aspartate carbamoyltransferase [Methyloprofundus sp.]|nr:aspartate carbamoyltransferase [Methyloprofundus sp.]
MITTDKLIFAFLISVYFATAALAFEKSSDARIKQVAELGSQVMPFNLMQTLHIFSKNDAGGLQQVVVKDPDNQAQIKLIRQHLEQIANDFKRADYTDPETIHGKDMPGLEVLRNAKAGELKIRYREIAEGAEILYSSDKAELVTAIHQWFDAQLRDHASHASMHKLHHAK